MSVTLLPLTDWIGDHPIRHGERGRELDADHPDACLCGEPDYLMCPEWADGIYGMTLYPGQERA